MTLPSENFVPMGSSVGLWIKGRITLAGNDMDQLFTGHYKDYTGPYGHGNSPMADEEYRKHRQKSSGVNKLPTVSKDFSRYGQLKRGDKFAEKMARNIPYVLDQSTWHKEHAPGVPGSGGETNEALVDNWKPVGLIPDWEIIKILEKTNKGQDLDEDPPGKLGQVMKLAQEFGVPIFDRERNKIWSPE